MLRLTTVGRRTGQRRVAILGYLEDGANLITPAMNGWADPEPAWWLNLQANPDGTVELPGGRREVTARVATADERPRLWSMLNGLGTAAYTDANAALRSRETAIVILSHANERIRRNRVIVDVGYVAPARPSDGEHEPQSRVDPIEGRRTNRPARAPSIRAGNVRG